MPNVERGAEHSEGPSMPGGGDFEAPSAGEVTRLLRSWAAGDPAAVDALFPVVYRELRRLADRYHVPAPLVMDIATSLEEATAAEEEAGPQIPGFVIERTLRPSRRVRPSVSANRAVGSGRVAIARSPDNLLTPFMPVESSV